MHADIVEGDLLDQDVEVIVNAWNRNLIPWWLLIPQGVSGAIKKKGGYEPFRELRKHGLIPLGGAVETGPGTLPFQAIIHVAGINLLWFATKYSIQESVRNAMAIVDTKSYSSVAFPIIGSGSGSRTREKALAFMLEAFDALESGASVRVVKHRKAS
ncbi:MAG: macro domain-containing protein [Deltaproteobacteria bacterium]|nr:macro domain-containing protein [Deltaproteobacteria bacterium]